MVAPVSNTKSLKVLFKAARQSGKLYLANRQGMKELPDSVFDFLEQKEAEDGKEDHAISMSFDDMVIN